jgi:hypothetical protein
VVKIFFCRSMKLYHNKEGSYYLLWIVCHCPKTSGKYSSYRCIVKSECYPCQKIKKNIKELATKIISDGEWWLWELICYDKDRSLVFFLPNFLIHKTSFFTKYHLYLISTSHMKIDWLPYSWGILCSIIFKYLKRCVFSNLTSGL